VFGERVTVFVLERAPEKTRAEYCPSDKTPSEIVSEWVVPDKVIVPASETNRFKISRFVFVVSPHVPDCSPSAISSIPDVVYVLGMSGPYAAISVQMSELLGISSVQTDPGLGFTGV